MGDSLTRLVQRTLGMAPVVRPVIAPLYAPGPVMAADGLRVSEEALPGEGVDFSLPPEDTSLMRPTGTHHRAMFSPADSEKPLGGDERSEPGQSALVDHSHDTLRRQPERHVEKTPMMDPPEQREAPSDGKPSVVFAVPEEHPSFSTPPHPEAPAQAPLLVPPQGERYGLMETHEAAPEREGSQAVFSAPEDSLLSSPGEPPGQKVLRPRVVVSERRSPGPVETPMKGDRRRRAPESATTVPTIRVTIGRVEVRANLPPAPAPRSKPARPGPMLSLADYLKRRDGGH